MTSDQRLALFDAMTAECRSIMETKGRDYSQGQEDCLSNFKRAAASTGITPSQVALVYLSKHLDSIAGYIKTGYSSEPIMGRFCDAVNYLVILAALESEWTSVQPGEDGAECTCGPCEGPCGAEQPV